AAGAAAVLAGLLAGARRAVRAALWMGLTLALLIVVVNALVVDRGETVLVRLGEWPLLGQVVVTAEAVAAGAVLGLRAAVVLVVFAVYSACVDPDRVLRSLRPLAGRSALTATLVSRLVPLAVSDGARLRDAAHLRGPAAAPVGRASLARRLLAGSLDRAVDVAATLELRGYALDARRAPRAQARSRYDGRFYAVGVGILVAGIAGKLCGADAFDFYPAIEIGAGPATLIVALVVLLAGFAPLPSRRAWRLSRPIPGVSRQAARPLERTHA
ncbi:MAG TPA: CbiQ family ECF transporter T component, partial [Solirubrobacterales bacterium]|nr:CbiQ family ECF transporter T component [Solirubrobacterales bacterium]